MRYRLILIALVSIALLSACGGKGSLRDESSVQRVDYEVSAAGYNHFVNADLLEIFGAYHDALKEYENALRYFPHSNSIRTDYARLLFRLHQVPEALRQALLIEPKSAEVNLLIGDCFRLNDQIEQAMDYYRTAVGLDPDNINAYWYLAGYYSSNGQDDSAIAAYYELARLSDTYRIWHELGTLLGKNGKFDEAKEAFQRAIELNPGKANINAYLGLATTYDALDSLEMAVEYLDKAKELDSFDVRIYRQELGMYLNREDLKKSIEASYDLVNLVPSDWVAQRRLGVLLYSDEQFDAADSLFQSRIEFGDDNILNHFYIARIAVDKENYLEARELFLDVVRREPSFADGWLNLGFVYRQIDSLGRAIEVYRQGLEKVPETEDQIRLMFALGVALERNNQFHETVEIFKQLIEKDPNHAPALNYLGYMLADRGEELRYALQLIERALEIAPDNGAYIDSYAWVHFKLGDFDVALAELKKAANLITDDPVIYEHMGDVYKAMGNNEEAKKQYRHALEIDPESLKIEEKMSE